MYFSGSQSDLPIPCGADDCMDGMTASAETVLALADGSSMDAFSLPSCETKLEATTADIASPPHPLAVPGVIGLQNLGNTCFMNSVLQCLLHCEPLCEYFLSGSYMDEINVSNPLGTGGKLVKEFAKLVEAFWKEPSSQIVVPRDLKYVIGEHAPMFLGYQQQDSQELVTFLLDGLHEDLNLVKNKPYTECIEANGRPDSEVASLSWEQHLRRNKSKIVDIFQGQFKSRLCCPQCNKSSVTFDPFMYLSLPIPNQPDLPLLITFSSPSLPSLPPVRFGIHVFRDASDLPRTIAAAVAAELPPEYSEEIVTNDILVYTQQIDSFELMDSTFLYTSGTRKKIFCSFAPGVSKSSLSPRISPKVSTDGPPSPKRARSDSLFLSVQVRMGRKSVPDSGTLVGAPCVISLSRSSEWSEFVSLLKRTVIYTTGGRSKEILEGMRTAKIYIGAEVFLLNSLEKPENWILPPKYDIPQNIFIHINLNDDACKSHDWSEEDEGQTWDDLQHSVTGRIGEYFRTEKSWKVMAVGSAFSQTVTSGVVIDDCFNLFATEEVLGEGDEWFCTNCSAHVCARKKIDLWKMPEILIIHLKRFQYTRGGFRNKIEAVIDFPVEDFLDLSPHLTHTGESCKYKIFGISNHSGSLYSGHYTAFSKIGDEWFCFNDSYVYKTSAPVPDAMNYLLFYRRLSST